MKRWVTLALLALALGACGGDPQDGASSGVDPQYTIAVVPKGLGHQFWFTVRAGAESAGEELGAKIIEQGEFSPGFPFLYIEDPDGYTIEIWFE